MLFSAPKRPNGKLETSITMRWLLASESRVRCRGWLVGLATAYSRQHATSVTSEQAGKGIPDAAMRGLFAKAKLQ